MRRLSCLGAGVLMLLGVVALPLAMMLTASGSTPASAASVPGIPPVLAQAYQQAAARAPQLVPKCAGMTWMVLAGIAQVESNQASGHTVAPDGEITGPIIGPRLDGSGAGGNTTAVRDTDHGRWDGDPVFDRAVGPFQFLPSTWASQGLNGRSTGAAPDPQNAFDAALSAAVYLCGPGRDLGTATGMHDAIFSFNHSEAYVSEVETAITGFTAAASAPADGSGASGSAAVVIDAALAEQGVPYSWGGGTAAGPSRGICCSQGGQDGRTVVGFDCSGLTLFAYAKAGITLPRLASAQAGIGRRIAASAGVAALRPGDLIFYALVPGNDASIYHVAIYLGGGRQVAAPRPGLGVETELVDTSSAYAGGAAIL